MASFSSKVDPSIHHDQWGFFFYCYDHYKLKDLNLLNIFQFTAMNIFTDLQIVTILDF